MGRTRSPSQGAASRVKKAWVWITTEAMPAVMPRCRPRNSRPNCPTPCASPYPTMKRQGKEGGRTNSRKGSDAALKRNAPSSMGLMACRPSFITTKFSPQMSTTTSALSQSPRDRGVFALIF